MNQRIFFILGPVLFILIWLINPFGIEPNQAKVLGVIGWMLTWWISESVPMAVTSLLPILLFPLLGVLKVDAVCAPYGDKFVFLFLGGFIIALAMEKWSLHRRIALSIIHLTGNSANRIVFGFMLASFLISMWISNTATALMMFPIGMSVVILLMGKGDHQLEKGKRNFSTSILLSIAYGSSIGGIATLVGSPPNAAMAGLLAENQHVTVSFFDWMRYGLPFAIILMVITYFLLVKVIFPNKLGRFDLGKDVLEKELAELGKMSKTEKRILTVFIATALLWIFQEALSSWLSPVELSDVVIAIAAGISLFIIPSSKKGEAILVWSDTEKLPWGVLLMFGGGLSLAKAFKESGLVDQITGLLDLVDKDNAFATIVLLCGIGLILTALMSNLAMVSIFVPVVAAMALASGKPPESFAIPVTIAASCDFMFPMSTPPNAIAYSSGYVHAKDMFKAGILLNIVSFVLLAIMVYFSV